MITALEVDPDEDLRPLSAWLGARGVPHRIFEASGRLRLAVPDESWLELVEAGRAAQLAGDLEGLIVRRRTPELLAPLRRGAGRAPVTLALVLLALGFYPATLGFAEGLSDWTLRWLLIVPIERVDEYIRFATLPQSLAAGEIWRLWTPALLHFGLLHLAFNLLWLWEFGRRIEAAEGRWRLLQTVLLLAPVANVAQYLMMDGPVFGGLSGVVYGLLGYIVTAHRRGAGHGEYELHPGLVVLLLLFLVLFSTGFTEPFGLHVANAAHWGGFVAGILWALIRVRPAAGPRG
ncbi:MAG: rhomboid family intramembrane serine protease [Gammaproteobacteria bacterium]|nr:rhomboid family intramembrane serine protease [Gammaproteobacteria bacterium]